MIELIFPDGRLRRLRDDIWHDDLETAAILLCEPARSEDDWRLTVREMHVVPPEASLVRTATAVVVDPAFGLPIEKKARIERLSLVYCHTHPHQTKNVAFSSIDDDAEIELAKYAEGRIPGVPHCALVFGGEAVASRRLGTRENVKVTEIQHEDAATYDRQIRAFGEEGQAAVARLRLGVVGLGGTGSVVVQQLAHLGVSDFLLVDPDVVETTNLNRTVGSTPKSVGESKVSVAAQMIRSIRPDARVEAIVGDVVDEGPAKRLTECDFIFCCTDSHASRHVINQLAYQYGISAIDMGVVIDASGSAVNFAGHVKALKDGEACLWCLNHLDPNQIREEMMTPDQRKADPYVVGARVVQPAIISINSIVASAAVTMFLSMVTGLDAPARFLVYDGNRQRLSGVAAERNPTCNFCGPDSPAGRRDLEPLPVRRHG